MMPSLSVYSVMMPRSKSMVDVSAASPPGMPSFVKNPSFESPPSVHVIVTLLAAMGGDATVKMYGPSAIPSSVEATFSSSMFVPEINGMNSVDAWPMFCTTTYLPVSSDVSGSVGGSSTSLGSPAETI